MQRNHLVSLACSLLLVGSLVGSEGAERRRVRFQGHELETVSLATSEDAADGAPAVFLLGYDPSTKAAVASALTSSGGTILQNIPASDHWLVRSTPADIESLQRKLPSVTAALLPKQAKVSEQVERTVSDVVRGTQENSNRGTWLEDLVHYKSEDGRTQIVLSVDRPAFTTVKSAYCSECPEKEEAVRAAEAWAHDMRDGLAAQLSLAPDDACQPLVKTFAPVGTLSLVMCAEHAAHAVTWLAEQGDVVSVDLVHAAKHNNLHASHAMQSGAFASPLPDNFGSDGTRQNLFPLWAAGITGKGQTVGVSDTGIDMDSCYFVDPAFADFRNNTNNIQNTTDENGVAFEHFSNSTHRKVISYFHFLDEAKKDLDGHGTHTAGTVAGAAYGFDPVQDPDLATGVAPEAKISFFDLSSGGWGLSVPGYVGNGTYASIFAVQLKEGARIATNSWGASQHYYASECRDIDAFAWANDMLIFYSAGNAAGRGWPGPLGVIGTPATCKNVLAIGATDNFHFLGTSEPIKLIDDEGNQMHQEGFQGSLSTVEELLFYTHYLHARYGKGADYKILSTGFVQALGPGSVHGLAYAQPLDACSSLTGDYSERVTLFESSSNCSLSEQVSNIKAAGAAAGMVQVNYTAFEEGIDDAELDGEDLPVAYVPYHPYLSNITNAFVVVKGGSPHDYLLDFSSFGPSDKDYILPTLTAPGIVLSAESTDEFGSGSAESQSSCNAKVTTKTGTSMASPTAAGSAALVRQYFADGFYPTGSKNAEDAFEPAASLVAAVLVASASSMGGVAIHTGQKLTMYDEFQGFGRISLSSLPLAGVTSENWRLQVSLNQAMARDREIHGYTVPANGEAPLILTLAYMDLPAQAAGYDAEPLLQNDLDLKVTAPDGSTFWGNNKAGGDRANTIEKVVIEQPQKGEYSVVVSTMYLQEDEGAQSYSFVALGGITGDMIMSVMPPGPSLPPMPPSPPAVPYPPPAAPWWPFFPEWPTEPPQMPFMPMGPPRPPSWPFFPNWPPPPILNEPPSPAPEFPQGPPPSPVPLEGPPPSPDPDVIENQRVLDVTYEMDIENEKADALDDESSSVYKKFKWETERYMKSQLPEGFEVKLDGLIVSSVRRRALLQGATTVKCLYIIQAPKDASSEEADSYADALASNLKQSGAAAHMMETADLDQFNIKSLSAETTGGGGDDGAQQEGPANILAAVLGAALLLVL